MEQTPVLLDAVLEIADVLLAASIESDHGLVWIRQDEIRGSRRRVLVPVDFGLEVGQLGIAYFFARLAAVSGDDGHRVQCRAALNPTMAAVSYAGPGPGFLERFGSAGLASVRRGLGLIAREQGVRASIPWTNDLFQENFLPEVTLVIPQVSMSGKGPAKAMDLSIARRTMARIDSLPYPEASTLAGGLAATLEASIRASLVLCDTSAFRIMDAIAVELAGRLRTRMLGGHLNDPALLVYSPCLVDGLSGIGIALLDAIHCRQSLIPARR